MDTRLKKNNDETLPFKAEPVPGAGLAAAGLAAVLAAGLAAGLAATTFFGAILFNF